MHAVLFLSLVSAAEDAGVQHWAAKITGLDGNCDAALVIWLIELPIIHQPSRLVVSHLLLR